MPDRTQGGACLFGPKHAVCRAVGQRNRPGILDRMRTLLLLQGH